VFSDFLQDFWWFTAAFLLLIIVFILMEEEMDVNNFPAGLRVLAVDDDRISLMILEKQLKHCNYNGEHSRLLGCPCKISPRFCFDGISERFFFCWNSCGAVQ